MITNKLIQLYKNHFCFDECDLEKVEEINAKHVFTVMPFLTFFGLILFVINIKKYFNEKNINNTYIFYYLFLIFASVFCFVQALISKKLKKIDYKIKIIPFYLSIFIFFVLTIYNIKESTFFYNGLLVFCIEAIITLFVFEISPIVWSLFVFFSLILITKMLINTDLFKLCGNIYILFFLVIILSFWKRYHTVRDFRQKRSLQIANQKSENLLLSILPKKVINSLEKTGNCPPEQFPNVTILFTDIVGFTEKAAKLNPEKLILELNDIFAHFDEIVEKNNCTRIKTIGDAYLAVCGLPEENSEHAKNIITCAKDFVSYLKERNETHEQKWIMRLGIHTGTVIAGIVGRKRYIYDIFGDSVNIANRMENLSEEMRINVSEDVYNLTKNLFSFEKRESKNVKGKGLMQMYFVE